MDTLILDSAFRPIGTISWQRAMTLLFSGKVEVLSEYPDRQIRSANMSMGMPAVVRILKWIRNKSARLRFNKYNLYMRDGGRCAYCGIHLHESKATHDHVLPRSRGGGKNWHNIVLSCSPCNRAKDCRTPEEAGMSLLVRPHHPTQLGPAKFSINNAMPDLWRFWIEGK